MSKPHLAYTIAIDPPGQTGCRFMAKLLAASLTRSQFFGDILIFHNSVAPIFFVERKGVEEISVNPLIPQNMEHLAQEAWTWKYRVRDYIDADKYDKIFFLDADCLALRNLDHLLEGDWDIAYKREQGIRIQRPQFSCYLSPEEMATLRCDGVNSGTIGIRGAVYQDVMREWERIEKTEPYSSRFCSDQASWNRLLLDFTHRTSQRNERRWLAKPFEAHEIQFPMHLDKDFRKYRDAAVLHFLGGTTFEKMQLMFAIYMGTYFHDDAGTLLNVTDM